MKFFWTLLRTDAAFVTGSAAAYFSYRGVEALILPLSPLSPLIALLVSLLVTIVVVRYIWARTASLQADLVRPAVLGGLVIGGIGFAAAYAASFRPGWGQTFLAAIFITGPLGLLLGGVGGGAYSLVRRRRIDRTHADGAG